MNKLFILVTIFVLVLVCEVSLSSIETDEQAMFDKALGFYYIFINS